MGGLLCLPLSAEPQRLRIYSELELLSSRFREQESSLVA